MSFSVSKAVVYGALMFVALGVGQAIAGGWSTQSLLIVSVAGGLAGGLTFGILMRELSVDVAGATAQSVEAAIRKAWTLKSFKASEGEDGTVRYTRGVGLLGDVFTLRPTATGVTLTGPASILGVVKRKAAGA